ncbi:MAG: type II toxin-antitoxin system VapC family toxin [Dehalococcoidia bacterium]
MILLDTHIWRWWVNNDPRLSAQNRSLLMATSPGEAAISMITAWEIGKLVERGRIGLDRSVDEWLRDAIGRSGVATIDLSLEVLVASTQLPAPMHRDPADQIIVATSRVVDIPLVTQDRQLLAYEHVIHAALPAPDN